MDNENVDRIVNSVINGVSQVGQAVGSVYSAFRQGQTGTTTQVTNNYNSTSGGSVMDLVSEFKTPLLFGLGTLLTLKILKVI